MWFSLTMLIIICVCVWSTALYLEMLHFIFTPFLLCFLLPLKTSLHNDLSSILNSCFSFFLTVFSLRLFKIGPFLYRYLWVNHMVSMNFETFSSTSNRSHYHYHLSLDIISDESSWVWNYYSETVFNQKKKFSLCVGIFNEFFILVFEHFSFTCPLRSIFVIRIIRKLLLFAVDTFLYRLSQLSSLLISFFIFFSVSFLYFDSILWIFWNFIQCSLFVVVVSPFSSVMFQRDFNYVSL